MQSFSAQYTSLDNIRTYVKVAAKKVILTDKAIYAMQMAVDEACTNIIDHAYGGETEKKIDISYEIKRDRIILKLHDNGKPFDMDSIAPPNLNAPLAEREVGGLGIHLIRRLMDGIKYKSTHEAGNTLILTKFRENIEIPSPDWRKLSHPSGALLNAKSLVSQRKRIQEMVAPLIDGEIDLWLDEKLFRLPDWDKAPIFSAKPPTNTMQEAFDTGEVIEAKGKKHAVALPLKDQGFIMGILEISRKNDASFSQNERKTLEGIASITALTLATSHRMAVEQWRVGQLKLVRQVGRQVANAVDVDELTLRITKLIQETFHYYYVAIFTTDKGKDILRFRAGAKEKGEENENSPTTLDIKMGEGLIGHVAQSGEEVLSSNVETESRYKFIAGLPETKSEIVFPLKIENHILGVLDVQSNRLDAFHPNDLLVLHALADNIAIAIQGARLYKSLEKRADQLALIAKVSKKAASTLNLGILMADITEMIKNQFGYPHVHLFTVHHNRRWISYKAGSAKYPKELKDYGINLDNPKGLVAWVARNGKSVLSNDVSKELRYTPSPLPPQNTKAELVVPLVFDNNIMGVLDIQSDKIDAFTNEDLQLFEALGDNVAAAIRNADLYRSEQWRRQVADSLREVAGLLSDNVSLDQVFNAILDELERNLPSEITTLWLLRDEGDLYLAAAHGLNASALEDARHASADASISLARALIAKEPLIRTPEDMIDISGFAAKFEQNYSSIAAPLRIKDQPVGVLALAHSTPGRYGHEAKAITSTFASYAAVAIENARLYDASQEQAYASVALLQVAQAVASMGELDEILDAIIRIMPILVGVGRCAIYLWDETTQKYTSSQQYGLSKSDKAICWQDIYIPGDFPLLDNVREKRSTLLNILDPELASPSWIDIPPKTSDDYNELLSREEDLLMAVPVKVKDNLFAVLLAEEASGGYRFRSRRLEIITGIVRQVALAIQNDHLQKEMVERGRLEQEVQVARDIQQTFIPDTLPKPPGWEMAARWKTARQVGGDFYDIIELPNNRLGLFIADVADKGMPAALFMTLTRTLVRAAIKDTNSPAKALRRVNDLLIPDTQQGMFVTAVYGELSLETGNFTYANAGHNPPFCLHKKTGEIMRLTRTGMALGVIEGTEMEQRTIRLEKNDILLLYTDGLTEAFAPDGGLFGEERIKTTLSIAENIPVQEILDQIEEELDIFVSTMPPADDLTMLAVSRLA